MKTRAILILFLVLSIPLLGQSKSSPVDQFDWQKQGVLFQLTIWKYYVEGAFVYVLENAKKKNDSINIIADYQRVKAIYDAATNQFLLEMQLKNCLARKFKRINSAYKNSAPDTDFKNDELNSFGRQLSFYRKESLKFKEKYCPSLKAAGIGDIDPVAGLTLVWSIYKDIKDLQGKKVEILSNILARVQLSSPKDLIESKK